MWAILPIRDWRCQDIDQVLLHEIIFFSQCIQQQWSVSQNYLSSIRSKLPTAACRSWEKREETVKPTCSMSKATSVPQTPQTNHSQCSSPVEALNLILESKSQPVELDSLTIELHVPSRRKKSLQSCCSVDFDFLPLMRFDMTLMPRCVNSPNSQIRVIKTSHFHFYW